MKFEIPFNEDIYRSQHKIIFDLAWNKNLKNNTHSLIIGLITLLVGVFILIEGNGIGFIFVGLAAFYFVTYYNYYSFYKKKKKNYFELLESEFENYFSNDTVIYWEFNENDFRYKDPRFETKIIWDCFKDMKVHQDIIFLSLDKDHMLSYYIGKNEVGAEDFDKLITFLNKKIKKQIPVHLRPKSDSQSS